MNQPKAFYTILNNFNGKIKVNCDSIDDKKINVKYPDNLLDNDFYAFANTEGILNNKIIDVTKNIVGLPFTVHGLLTLPFNMPTQYINSSYITPSSPVSCFSWVIPMDNMLLKSITIQVIRRIDFSFISGSLSFELGNFASNIPTDPNFINIKTLLVLDSNSGNIDSFVIDDINKSLNKFEVISCRTIADSINLTNNGIKPETDIEITLNFI